MSSAFVPGFPPTRPRLLARFQPPLAEGVAAHFVEAGSRPGDLVLDPFGQAPQVELKQNPLAPLQPAVGPRHLGSPTETDYQIRPADR